MTMPTLMHPSHTMDPCDRTTGPNRVPEPLIHLPIGVVPLGAKPTTKHLCHRDQGTQPTDLFILRLLEPIQMTQGPSITEQAPGFAPLGATELRTCLIQLLLSLPPTQPMTLRGKPYQSRLDLLHHLCRLDRLVEEPLRLAPSPSRVARHASGILTATIQLGHFRIDLAGHLHLLLGLFPLALLDALKLALAMKHIKTHGDRVDGLCLLVLGLSLTLLIGQLHPFLKTRAAIGNDVLQTWPLLHDLAPTLAAAIWTALARQPSPARGFDTHQDGIAMKEDFVQTPHPHQALANPLQDLQDATRLLRALLHPAPHHGSAGHHPAGQQHRQQDHNLTQAQAHGRARRRQLTL